MSGYAPAVCSTAESKYQFYEELDVGIGNIHKPEQLYLHGDFNAIVGADHEALSSATIMDRQSQTHYLITNRVKKCPGDITGRVIDINLILSSPDTMLLTVFSTHAATTMQIAILITR